MTGVFSRGLSQTVEQFKVTSTGVAPIRITIDSIAADQMYIGTMELLKPLCTGDCSLSGDGNKFIQLDGIQQKAFNSMNQNFLVPFDLKFTLLINISDHQMNMEYRVGKTYIHNQNRSSGLTYTDFFKKSGDVKEQYQESKNELERAINAFPVAIYQHLKKNYIPKLVSKQNEKGYVQGGFKISVWQYFDSKGRVEMVINYNTGKLMYQKPDTARYFVIKNSSVEALKLDVRPMPTFGFQNFFMFINDTFNRDGFDSCDSLDIGRVVVNFDVDTLGYATNWALAEGTNQNQCYSGILSSLKKLSQIDWITAVSQKRKVVTRFAIPIVLRSEFDKTDFSTIPLNSVEATVLDPIVLTLIKSTGKVYNFVENSAEFIGGMRALSKWLSQNLKYPPSARRMGLEGRVTVKFIIERDGTISNADVLRGFDRACDKEAVRVVSIMPKWKPGRINGGTPVRQSCVMPIEFKLSE
jgi:TonB family protein